MVQNISVGSAYQSGGSYLYVFMTILFIGVGLNIGAKAWSVNMQRQKEKELLFTGNQIRTAIEAYYYAVTPNRYPKALKDLVLDKRFGMIKRYLRKEYSDPITGKNEWGVVRGEDGGISGVYSLSNETPMQKVGFNKSYSGFSNKNSYQEWVFLFEPKLGFEN